ncbi:hypothetical protein O1D97_10195 [Marinomonas sp. 15G1-11]|uniref:Uncharacterized protein n=1 Tax=Marinomonas phaeophyticola TaxID=3004091 RepID=A0ABT4JW40_9GAMM|nr:hypothetical protein [Marinomonas sp. 15G1-11]MCZ2722013.1 hypothetical protein [Marinomonas sp. 15G1-11]
MFNSYEFRRSIEEQAARLTVLRASGEDLFSVRQDAIHYSDLSSGVSKEEFVLMDQTIHENLVSLQCVMKMRGSCFSLTLVF